MRIMPGANWRPVPSHSGLMRGHQGLVLHVQVGNNSCYGEFANPANQASSTWWVSKTGVIEQYVDADMTAWTEAAGNSTWDSVETEGVPGEALTQAQILSVARIYVYGMQQYGWPISLAESPNGVGLGWHGMGGAAWGGHIGCPGDLRRAQRGQILYLAGLSLNKNEPTSPVHTNPQGETMIAHVPTGGIVVARPDGAVDTFDGARFYGSMSGKAMNAPVVGIGSTPSGNGYWLIGADGGIFTFGDAPYLGPLPKYLQKWGVGANYAFKILGITASELPGQAYTIVADPYPAGTAAATYHIPSDGSLTK